MDNVLLLVEPDVEQANVIKSWLKETGYTVSVAYSLKEAFSKIKIKPSLYYLCILDADFPGGITEGLEVCRRLKSDEVTKNVPLVLLTFRGRPNDIISGLDSGADLFLLKPFETDYFSERIRFIIDDMQSKKYMKGVIDLALIEFLLSLKEGGDKSRFLIALSKGFNRVIWNKIFPIMGFMPLQVTLERAKKTLGGKYSFVDGFTATEGGIQIDDAASGVENISWDEIAEGFMHFLYHFLDIIVTLTGNIVADMDMLKRWDERFIKSGR